MDEEGYKRMRETLNTYFKEKEIRGMKEETSQNVSADSKSK